MNKYTDLQSKHGRMINDFPIGFAFSDKQFKEAKEKLGVKNNDELLRIASGGFIKKTDKQAYNDMIMKMNKESENALQDDEYLYQGFLYELANHEYCITCDFKDTLSCFNLTIEDAENNTRIKDILIKARREYLDSCEC